MYKFCAVILATGIFAAILWMVVPSQDETTPESVSTDSKSSYSNIHPEDYVGPQACEACHAEHFANWQTHAHSRMNLNPAAETVVGDFSGTEVPYGNGHIRFEHEGADYFMSLYEGDNLSRKYRVTRTVGSRFTQMYIGLQTEGPEPKEHHAYHIEGKLPFGYWMKRRLWTPVSYFDSAYEPEPDDGAAQMELLGHPQQESKWELNCLYCHNTYAYQHRLYFASAIGFPREDFVFPGGMQTLQKFGALSPDKLVTLGISCESCHYGGREHVRNGLPTRYYPSSPDLSLTGIREGEQPTEAGVINSICMQCHCAEVQLYPNGAATWNSREAIDLKTGGCMQQVKCTDCHNPHVPGLEGGLFSKARIEAKCMDCHQELQDETNRLLHTQHSDETASCIDCHMPRIVQGLDSVLRTHHISSPTNVSMLKTAAPNACNLCHLNESIDWTVQHLNKGWNQNIVIGSDWSKAYGADLKRSVGKAWLNHDQPVIRLVCSDAWKRHPKGMDALPELLTMLTDSYSVNRMFGLFAVESLLGRTLHDFNPMSPISERQDYIDRLRQILAQSPPHGDQVAAEASPD